MKNLSEMETCELQIWILISQANKLENVKQCVRNRNTLNSFLFMKSLTAKGAIHIFYISINKCQIV